MNERIVPHDEYIFISKQKLDMKKKKANYKVDTLKLQAISLQRYGAP